MKKQSTGIKKYALALAALLAVTTAAGCSGQKDSAPSAAPGSEPASQVPASSQAAPSESSTADGNFNPMGFPIVNEQVTKNFMIKKPPHIGDPNAMPTLQKYEEMTNVKVSWDIVSSDGFTERVNLVMASNTMPDAILKGTPDITKTSADGSIIDISGLIDQYSVGIKGLFTQYPEVEYAAKSPDGNIYSVPNINTLLPNRTGHRNNWINQKWLDKLGLSAPSNLDEFVEVMKAFRDQDPNGNGKQDEIPYVVEYGGGDHIARVDNFAASWGLYPNMGYQLQIKDLGRGRRGLPAARRRLPLLAQ